MLAARTATAAVAASRAAASAWRPGACAPLPTSRRCAHSRAPRLARAAAAPAPGEPAGATAAPSTSGAQQQQQQQQPEGRLASKRCEPCEAAKDAEGAMGLHSAFDRGAAERYLAHLQAGWRIITDDKGRLRIRRRFRTKNFVKGLELLQRFGAVAEEEGHHPDLAIESWNNITVCLWTHERDGLTENDFIVAAKLDEVEKADLLSKKPPLED